jgi:hypothetical protein
MLGHGFHPSKAQLTLSKQKPQPVRPKGRTPAGEAKNDPIEQDQMRVSRGCSRQSWSNAVRSKAGAFSLLDSSRRPRKDADGGRAKEVLARHAGIKDPKILDISYEDFRQLSPANIEPTKAAAENIMAQFPDGSRNVGDYVDLSILDELTKDGVFMALQEKYPR